MTSPFRCGPNPCEWPCEYKVKCLQWNYLQLGPALGQYDQIAGSFSNTATTIITTTPDSIALHNTEVADDTVRYIQGIIPDSDVPKHYRCFCKANEDCTEYFYADWFISGDGSSTFSIGTEVEELDDIIGPTFSVGGQIYYITLCVDENGNFKAELKTPASATYKLYADRPIVSTNKYAGFGNGSLSTRHDWYSDHMELLKSTENPHCLPCPIESVCAACNPQTTPTEMLLEFEGVIADLNCSTCWAYTDVNVIVPFLAEDICAYWAYGPLPTNYCPIQTYPSIEMFYDFQINTEAPPVDTRTLEATIYQRYKFDPTTTPLAAIARFYHRTPYSSSEQFDCYEYLKNGVELLPDDRLIYPAPFYCDWINSPGLKCTATALAK